ncbi:MAG: TetR/AcrR family transcriptional regulator [Anaerolineae bacterium]|nr:TetR/AcrR family transcriptional regulator [Anaerolineae bacterium]
MSNKKLSEKTSYHHGDLKNALIQAGIEILAEKGVHALSLRRVARRAGVSHTAPYAHFADKQSLVAAISTEGYKKLYNRVYAAVQLHQDDPLQQLIEASWAYIEFALKDPAHFKITLSGVVEQEKSYPEYVEITKQNFRLVVTIVETCQRAGILRAAPPDLMAITVWSQVHGFISLVLEGQISHVLLESRSLKEIWLFSLNQLTISDIG